MKILFLALLILTTASCVRSPWDLTTVDVTSASGDSRGTRGAVRDFYYRGSYRTLQDCIAAGTASGLEWTCEYTGGRGR